MYKNVSYSYTIVLILLFLSCFTLKTFAAQLAIPNHSKFLAETSNKHLVVAKLDSIPIKNTHFPSNIRFIQYQSDPALITYMPDDHILAYRLTFFYISSNNNKEKRS
jgi:hypothetical protein